MVISPLVGRAAKQDRKAFDVPAGAAEQTLKKFSQQSGLQVVFAPDATDGVRTTALKGEFTPMEAVNRLLADTDLGVIMDEKTDVLSIVRLDKPEGAGPNVQRAAQQSRSVRPDEGPGRSGVVGRDDVVKLSPFEVTESNNGYLATNTMSGTRLNSSLEDLGSSISVVTKQQMSDFAMLDINDIFAYEAGAEGVGTYTAFEINRNGQMTDNVQSDRESSNRLRGIGAANISRSGFATSGRVPVDPIDIDAVEISRGPNSSIFGLGEGSGTVNMVAASANLNREISQAQVRFDNTGGWRTSFDLNRTLIPGKLAARVSGVYQHDEDVQKPSSFNTRRMNAMIRIQPFKSTTLRASFQSYFADGARGTAVTPRDGVTYWREMGSPTWDPVTQTATVNGVSTTYSGTTNPPGLANLNRAGPIMFVDDGGIRLWQIGRMPAATATNGAGSITGVNRMLESFAEPIRDGRPLFSILRGVSDPSVYDYAHVNLASANYQRERTDTSTVEFEQFILNTGRNTLAFQFAWQREESDRLRKTIVNTTSGVGQSFLLRVDPNSRLLDGRPNPFFLKPYFGAVEPVYNETPFEQDSYRGQLAYVLDLTREKSKWLRFLGRQQLLGYYEERKSKNRVYNFRDVMISDNPIYAPAGQTKGNALTANGYGPSSQATRPYFHYYVGDANGQNADYGPSRTTYGIYDFTWYNPQTKQWVTDQATFGQSAVAEGSAGENANSTVNLIQTKGAILQSSFFGNRLVTTFGLRSDQSGNKRQDRVQLLPNGYEYDYARMSGWRGDWAIRNGDTTTKGGVIRPFRDWGFIENARSGTGWKAGVASVLQGLSFFYNRSDSFRPAAPAISIKQNELPNPSSIGQDYGITVSFGGKFSLRVNHYTTDNINSRAGQGALMANRLMTTDFQGFAAIADTFALHRQAVNWLTQLNPSTTLEAAEAEAYRIQQLSPDVEAAWRSNTVADTTNIFAKGEEYELNFNPSSFWTLRANVTRTVSIDGAQSPDNFDWLNQRMPVWETIVDPRSGKKWLDTSYAGEFPSTGTRTPRDYILSNILTQLRIDGATAGTARPQIREWRFNVATSYRLAGLTDHRVLKNLTVGGGVRWESKGAIGYYGIPIDGNIEVAESLDPTRPIWDKAHAYFDAFLTYRTKLFNGKVPVRFQLNVRNIQESKVRLQAVGAYPNGEAHTFRIVNPRTFVFTTTFDL